MAGSITNNDVARNLEQIWYNGEHADINKGLKLEKLLPIAVTMAIGVGDTQTYLEVLQLNVNDLADDITCYNVVTAITDQTIKEEIHKDIKQRARNEAPRRLGAIVKRYFKGTVEGTMRALDKAADTYRKTNKPRFQNSCKKQYNTPGLNKAYRNVWDEALGSKNLSDTREEYISNSIEGDRSSDSELSYDSDQFEEYDDTCSEKYFSDHRGDLSPTPSTQGDSDHHGDLSPTPSTQGDSDHHGDLSPTSSNYQESISTQESSKCCGCFSEILAVFFYRRIPLEQTENSNSAPLLTHT
jgi:hypothetical protein